MIGATIELTGVLETLSPMHIGSGEVGVSRSITSDTRPGSNERVEIALVAADGQGRPVIPGSSLKGALRSVLADHDNAIDVFGPEEIIAPEDAFAGRVVFWAAMVQGSQTFAQDAMAYGNTERARPLAFSASADSTTHAEVGLYVDARTAIEPGTGTAQENRLFHKQMVPTGTRFGLRIAVDLRAKATLDEGLAHLATVTKRLASGIEIGSGANADQGRLKLQEDSIEVKHHKLDGSSDDVLAIFNRQFAEQNFAITTKVEKEYKITLTCNGPFLVNNSAATRAAKARADDADRDPQLSGLRDFATSNDFPRLPGTSILGALRSRALWLGRLGDAKFSDDPDRVFTWIDDDENPPPDPDKEYKYLLDRLTSSERLFGINGWRGLLQVNDICGMRHAGWTDITSVKLDRFSGAPIDGGLFTTRASVDPVFELTLQVNRRDPEPRDTDIEDLERLLRDIKANGLRLGHGTNRGYGWFSVEADGL